MTLVFLSTAVMAIQSGGRPGTEMRDETGGGSGHGSGGEPEGKPGDVPESKPGGESEGKPGGKSGVGSGGESGDETLEGKAEERLLPVDSGLEAVGLSLLRESNSVSVLGDCGLAAGLVIDHGVNTEVCADPDFVLWLESVVGSEIGSELAS